MNKDKINSFEFCSIVPLIVSNSLLGSSFLFLYNFSNKSALICMFLGLIISILFLKIISKIFSMLPNKSLNEKVKEIFPKWLYYLINVLFILIMYLISFIVFFRLTSFFSTQFTGGFPKLVISSVLVLTTYYLTSKNIEVLVRFSSIALFICVLVSIFNCTSLIPHVNINNILPIIDTSFKNILLSSLVFSILFSGPFILLLIIPKNSIVDKNKLKKYMFITYILSSIFLLAVNFFTLSVLGINSIKLYIYPAYIVLKNIHVFEFINSIENIIVLMWFFILLVTISFALFNTKKLIIDTFNINNEKVNIIINIILNISVAFLPVIFLGKNPFLNSPKSVIAPIIIYLTAYLLLLILLFVEKIKRKKESKD